MGAPFEVWARPATCAEYNEYLRMSAHNAIRGYLYLIAACVERIYDECGIPIGLPSGPLEQWSVLDAREPGEVIAIGKAVDTISRLDDDLYEALRAWRFIIASGSCECQTCGGTRPRECRFDTIPKHLRPIVSRIQVGPVEPDAPYWWTQVHQANKLGMSDARDRKREAEEDCKRLNGKL